MFGCSYYLMQDSFSQLLSQPLFTAYFLTSHCLMRRILVMTKSPTTFWIDSSCFQAFANHAFVWSSLPYECCKLFKAFFFFAEMPLLSIGKMLFRLSLRLPVYLFLSVSKSLNLHLAEGQILFWYDEC